MTTTAPPPPEALPRARRVRARRLLTGCAIGAIVAVIVVVATRGGDPLDSDGADGFSGLRLMLERRGATVSTVAADEVDATTVRHFDVAVVMDPGDVSAAQAADWYDFVHAGGRLVMGRSERGSPDKATGSPHPTPRGTCTMAPLQSIDEMHVRGGSTGHVVNRDEGSCFGTRTAAQITASPCGTGEKVTLSDVSMFDNETMGAPTSKRNRVANRSNAEVAAVILETGPRTRIAIVTGDVPRSLGLDDATARRSRCAQSTPGGSFDSIAPREPGTGRPGAGSSNREEPRDGDSAQGQGQGQGQDRQQSGDPGDRDTSGANQGSTSDEGQNPQRVPSGGDRSSPGLLDRLPAGVLLALAQLIAVALWYVLRRARRDAVVAQEDIPVTVGSSRVVEASGALRRRAGDVARSGEDLRRRTSEQLTRAFGLAPGSGAEELARRIEARTGRSAERTMAVIAGERVHAEDELLALAQALEDLRRAALAFPLGPRVG